jgi:hypothetical protein
MYKNLESEDLNKENVSVYLCAQIFLTTRYKYGESQQVTGTAKDRKEHLKRSPMDRKEEESGRLGISETAMTNLFQRQRWKVLVSLFISFYLLSSLLCFLIRNYSSL